MNLHPFESRDAIYKMEYVDLLKNPRLLSVDMLNERFSDLNNKISNGFFGQNQTSQTIIEKGLELHKKVLDYLNNKVLTEDLDFSNMASWEHTDIIVDGKPVKAQAPIIVSASRSTDIPAFYADWFLTA